MALNASIFGNMLNAPKSPEEYAAERENLAATRSTNMLNQAKVGEYQAGIKRQGELRNLLAGGADAGALRKAGFLEEAGSWDKNNAAVAKDRAAADEHSFNLAQKRYDTYRKAAASRYNDPNLSKQSVIGDIEQMKGMGVLSPELADHLASQLPDDPMQLRDVVKAAAMSQLNGEQLLTAFGPKPEKFDNGGQIITRDMNPNSPTYGQNTGGAPITKVVSPDSQLQAETTRRGQNMTDSRARDFNAVQVEANNIKRSEKKDVADLTKNSQVASFDTMLGTLDRLSKHPGLSRSVGLMGAMPTMPGSDSANFQAELNTFQSQAFLPMVAQLKGMGALSDAEGKKLTAAVGALDPKMGEQAFRDSVGRITSDMEAARARVSGSPRSSQPAAPAKTLNAQDQQAAAWAKANPNDPRAAQIKQRLGL